MLDNTVSTMGDLLGFEGHLNSSTPFSTQEYKAIYKDPSKTYTDWFVGNEYNQTCVYPKFWLETGFPVGSDVTDQLVGCYNSEFDQV
jgi:alpha-1,3-glucan synthase